MWITLRGADHADSFLCNALLADLVICVVLIGQSQEEGLCGSSWARNLKSIEEKH
jgi:hypothetical protein